MHNINIHPLVAGALLLGFVLGQGRVWGADNGTASTNATNGEALVIIVHKSNPVDNLGADELRKLCLMERKHWSNGRKVTVVLRDIPQPERTAALRGIYGMKENEFTRHFLQASFTGELQDQPRTLASAGAVKRFVFNVPGAIGFARLSEVDDTVKVVRLDGHAPSDPEYGLRLAAKH